VAWILRDIAEDDGSLEADVRFGDYDLDALDDEDYPQTERARRPGRPLRRHAALRHSRCCAR
jgi:hypothetical protein